MAKDDIYRSKARYERAVRDIPKLIEKPTGKGQGKARATYYCKSPANLKYFEKLVRKMLVKDLSYLRRYRLIHTLKIITWVIEKDLKDVTRDDIDELITYSHTVNKTANSKGDFIKDVKCTWKDLFPAKDEMGREDERLTPYVVRHLKRRQDKSKDERRNEIFTGDEFEKIIKYFDNEPYMQAYLSCVYDTFTRPQELCYLKLGRMKFYDTYGLGYVDEHGKEGCKTIQFEILSYPYVLKWYNLHPFKDDPNAYFFVVPKNGGSYSQITPYIVNSRLKRALKDLEIDKKITPYTFKRMGITNARLSGVPDKEIQAKAGWTSTKQMPIYDLYGNNEALRMSLIRQGLAEPESENEMVFKPIRKICRFCDYLNSHTDTACGQCRRLLDSKDIKENREKMQIIQENPILDKILLLQKALDTNI